MTKELLICVCTVQIPIPLPSRDPPYEGTINRSPGAPSTSTPTWSFYWINKTGFFLFITIHKSYHSSHSIDQQIPLIVVLFLRVSSSHTPSGTTGCWKKEGEKDTKGTRAYKDQSTRRTKINEEDKIISIPATHPVLTISPRQTIKDPFQGRLSRVFSCVPP